MSCPICQREPDTTYQPFCSKRCADVDLGKWLTGSYAVPSQSLDDTDELEAALTERVEKPH